MKLNLNLNIQKEVHGSTKNDGSGNYRNIDIKLDLVEFEGYVLCKYSDARVQCLPGKANGSNSKAVFAESIVLKHFRKFLKKKCFRN